MKEQNTPLTADGVLPDSAALEEELRREQYKRRYRRTLLTTIFMLITAAAAAVLVANLWLPVLQIYGKSMNPTLREGDIVVSVKASEPKQGDVIAFYYGNKLLVKRCIAVGGDEVNVREDGTIEVNGTALDEPYVADLDFGGTDIALPYTVPGGRYFLVGDNRAVSVDSRHTALGVVGEDQIVGKVVLRIWPFSGFGAVN